MRNGLLKAQHSAKMAPNQGTAILYVKTGEDMKARTIVLILAMCLVAVAVCFASDPNMGTWKLNDGKSKLVPGAPQNSTVVYEAAVDMVKVTTDGTTGDGKPMHTEWTGKFDGKDYPLTGDPSADTRSYKKVNDHTMDINNKMGGKVVVTGRIVVAADGKSRTVTTTRTDSTGKKITNVAVFDKQ